MGNNWKQYIVINSSLNMSAGKLGAQVSHASMAFLTRQIQNSIIYNKDGVIKSEVSMSKEMYDNWINGIFTKVCLDGKNESFMQKFVNKLESNGFKENVDFFKIIDVGTTEFNGIPQWTCIGFKPLDTSREDVKFIFKRLQLYHKNIV